jgi:hypothetical protein
MSAVRALAFVSFMVSAAVLSSVNTQAKAVFHCSEQESCNDLNECGGACSCTCDNLNQWPYGCGGAPYYPDGFCAILYSAE